MKSDKEIALRSSDTLNAAQATTLQRMVEGQKASEPHVTVKGKDNKIDLRFEGPPPREELDLSTDQNQQAGSMFNSKYKFSQALPWGIALLMFAIAVVAIVKAYKYARAQSPAIESVFKTAEEIIAKRIGAWRDKNMVETNPHKLSEANAHVAELQRDLSDLKQAKFDQTP